MVERVTGGAGFGPPVCRRLFAAVAPDGDGLCVRWARVADGVWGRMGAGQGLGGGWCVGGRGVGRCQAECRRVFYVGQVQMRLR